MMSAAGNKASLRQRGFTLLELIVVLSITAMLLAVTFPALSRGSSALHLRTTGRDVLNTFRYAKEQAVTEQIRMEVMVHRAKQEIVLSNFLGEKLRTYTLPRDVRIHRLAVADREIFEEELILHFLPNGSSENAQVLLRSNAGALLRIVSDPLSGGARIEPVQGEVFP